MPTGGSFIFLCKFLPVAKHAFALSLHGPCPWRARKRRAASPRGRAARHRRHLLPKLPQLGQRHVPAARVPADERLQAAAEGDWLAHDRDRLAGVARARVVLLPRRPRAVPRRGS